MAKSILIEKISKSAKGKKYLTVIAVLLVGVEMFSPSIRQAIYSSVPEAEEATDQAADRLAEVADSINSVRGALTEVETTQGDLSVKMQTLDTSFSEQRSNVDQQMADAFSAVDQLRGEVERINRELAQLRETLPSSEVGTPENPAPLRVVRIAPTPQPRLSPMEIRAEAERERSSAAMEMFQLWQKSKTEEPE